MFDDETQKALRTHHAEACQMARDYLGRLLDESDGEGGGGE